MSMLQFDTLTFLPMCCTYFVSVSEAEINFLSTCLVPFLSVCMVRACNFEFKFTLMICNLSIL